MLEDDSMTMDNHHLENVLRKRFSRIEILETQTTLDEERLLIDGRNLVDALRFFKSDPDTQLDMLVDISAIQHVDEKSCIYQKPNTYPFFEVFYLLRSTKLKYQLRISVEVPETMPSIPTVVSVFKGANWLERELYDMFGVYVEGHPYLRRILTYPSFKGHPLVKSYPPFLEQPLVKEAHER